MGSTEEARREHSNSEEFRKTFLRSDREGPTKAKMAGKKEAKRKAGPSGQREKNKKETEGSKRTKNGSRRGRRKEAQKARLQPPREQAAKAQEEENTMCVGVLHVSSRTEWACQAWPSTRSPTMLSGSAISFDLSQRGRERGG